MKNLLVFPFPFYIKVMHVNNNYYNHDNKGFINYVFCRKWAVRNPAGTRQDFLAW